MAIERIARIARSGAIPEQPNTGDAIAEQLGAVEFGGFGDDIGTGNGDGGSDSGGNSGGFDPAIHSGPDKFNADGSYRRKRGRRAGSTNSAGRTSTRADLKASVDSLSNILVIVHAGLAVTLKTPELALAEQEGKVLATGVANVLEQFDIRPDPKIEAVIGLIIAASSVYGPKVYMYRERRKEERKEERERRNITPGYN